MNRQTPDSAGGAAPGQILLQVVGLTKSFQIGEKEIGVLKGIDLEIRKGETIAILGVSGVGKTTLLHILGALDHPTQGRVAYCGQDQFTRSDRELARFRNQEIGFVFQFHYLLSDLSALENTMLPARIAGVPRKQAERKAAGLLEELGLAERMAHRPGKLSGGEQQRVAVARAVIMDPQIILADEPTGNLDSKTGQDILAIFDDLHRNGHTVILVTHDSGIAARARRIIRIVDGLISDGDGDGAAGGPSA